MNDYLLDRNTIMNVNPINKHKTPGLVANDTEYRLLYNPQHYGKIQTYNTDRMEEIERFAEGIDEYFTVIKQESDEAGNITKEGQAANIMDLCSHIGLHYNTFNKYLKKEAAGSPQSKQLMHEICSMAKQQLVGSHLRNGLSGNYSQGITQLVLGKYGYNKESTINLKVGELKDIDTMTDTELQQEHNRLNSIEVTEYEVD